MMPMPELDNRLDAVLSCVKYFGAAVLPVWGVDSKGICDCPKGADCKSPGKHPHRNVPNGVNGATRDIAIIREWSNSYKNSNWALRCGEPMPGGGFLAVLDEDPRNGSVESIACLPDLPETATQLSGGAGRHRVFRFPHAPASRTVGPGLDLQGGGKYIVIAPSRHHTGGFYSWDLGLGPGEIDIAKAPEWLVEGTGEAIPRPTRDGEATAEHTVLGELFKLSGRCGPVMPSGQMFVNCPNSAKHGEERGKGGDSSTVLLPPAGGSQFGGFKCLHSSCANLKWHDILKMMPEDHVKAAQKKYPPRLVSVPKDAPGPAAEEEVADPYESLRRAMAWTMTKSGWQAVSDIVNVITVLTYDPRWVGVLKFDEFAQVLRFAKPPQWHKDDAGKNQSEVWTDDDTTRMDAWMRRYWGIKLSGQELAKAAYVVARRDSINPLRDWLNGLEWDGTARLSTWLTRYMGVDDSPYTQAVARKWLISAVARGVTPGCKADHVIILEGGQGVGKSTALRLLAGGNAYFTDSPIDIGNKDSFVSLRGKWIIELAELASLSKAESEKSKAFFSSPTDSYRPPYGRELVQVPRTCVFAGSTNVGQYLNDETGGRRYWPVKVGVIDLQGLEYDREQIWAEAVAAFKAGETWWPSYAESPMFEAEQMAREVGDTWEERIAPWLESKTAVDIMHKYGFVTQMQIIEMALGIEPKESTMAAAVRVARVMYHLGYKKDRRRASSAGRVTVYLAKRK